MSEEPYKIFISDLHGQADVFDMLAHQYFGVVDAIIIDHIALNPNASKDVLRFYLLGEGVANWEAVNHLDSLTSMMTILLDFKHEHNFWTVSLDSFASCSWFLSVIDEYAVTGSLDQKCRESIALLDGQDQVQLCHYIAKSVKRLIRYRLHVVGDIYDRGPGAAQIIDRLETLPFVSIQWGNHDVLWMGAASGSLACIATVVRLCLKSGHVATLTKDYGICLDELSDLADSCYSTDPCSRFLLDNPPDDQKNRRWEAMHKAITIIQFKLEQQLIERNPSFLLEDRALLKKIVFSSKTIDIQGSPIALLDANFPTVNPNSTSSLTNQEWRVVESLKAQFIGSSRLQHHIRFLFANGGLLGADGEYTMFHGCVPVDLKLNPVTLDINGKAFKGRALFDALELQLRKSYTRRDSKCCHYLSDIAWYLWCGSRSPLFGRDRMTTFERYFVADKNHHKESSNPYFRERNNPDFVSGIALELSGNARSILVNGHIPVKLKEGESPYFSDGKLVCIDGGFSKSYRDLTGAAGMVLISRNDESHLFSIEDNDSMLSLHEVSVD